MIYSIFVLDLKLIKWEVPDSANSEDQQSEAAGDQDTALLARDIQEEERETAADEILSAQRELQIRQLVV